MVRIQDLMTRTFHPSLPGRAEVESEKLKLDWAWLLTFNWPPYSFLCSKSQGPGGNGFSFYGHAGEEESKSLPTSLWQREEKGGNRRVWRPALRKAQIQEIPPDLPLAKGGGEK